MQTNAQNSDFFMFVMSYQLQGTLTLFILQYFNVLYKWKSTQIEQGKMDFCVCVL